ncbi:hypothetical protein GC177_06710 [bacterium]|nr:hypothetical protein [bacterium]
MYNNCTAINKHPLSVLYKQVLSVCRNTAAFLKREEGQDQPLQTGVRDAVKTMLERMEAANLINATPEAILTTPGMRTPLHSLPVETVQYQAQAMNILLSDLASTLEPEDTLPRIRVALDNIDEHQYRDLHAYEGFLVPSRGGMYSMLQFINLLQHKSLAEYYGNNTHGGNPHIHEGNIFAKPVVIHREGDFWTPLLDLLQIDEEGLARDWNIHFAGSLEECAEKMTEGWWRYRNGPHYQPAQWQGNIPEWDDRKLVILFSRTAEKLEDIKAAIANRPEYAHITVTDIGEIEHLMAHADIRDGNGRHVTFAFQSPLETSLSYSGNAEEKLAAAFDAMKQIGMTRDQDGNQTDAGRQATRFLLDHFGVGYSNVLIMVDDAGLNLNERESSEHFTFPALDNLPTDAIERSIEGMTLNELYKCMHESNCLEQLRTRLATEFQQPIDNDMLGDWMLYVIWNTTLVNNLPFPGVELAYARDAAGGFGPLMKRLQQAAETALPDAQSTINSNYTQLACSLDALRGTVDITRVLAVHDARDYLLARSDHEGRGYAPELPLEKASTWHFSIPLDDHRTVRELPPEEAAFHNQRQSCFLTLLDELQALSHSIATQADRDDGAILTSNAADGTYKTVA